MNSDYEEYDLLIGMDRANLRDMYRICGGDFMDKMRLLLDYTDRPGQEVADPWYTCLLYTSGHRKRDHAVRDPHKR